MTARAFKYILARPALYLVPAAVFAFFSYLACHFWVLGGVPHVTDEAVYIFQAKTLARGVLAAPAPAAPIFFDYLNVIIDRGRGIWYGMYAPGWPGVLMPFLSLGVAPLANALVNTIGLLAVYRLGVEIYGRKGGGVALLLGALSPFMWAMGASYLSHPLSLALAAAALLGVTVGLRRDRPRYLLAAGAAAGAMVLVRQLDAAAVAATLVLLLAFKREWKGLVLLAAGAAPFVGVLFLYNRALTGSPWLFPHQVYSIRDAVGFGPAVGKVSTYGSLGHTPLKALYNLRENARAASTNLLGWPFLSLAFIPFAFLARRPRHRRGLLLLGTYGVIYLLAYGFYYYHGVMFGPRYYYALLPALLLLSAGGIMEAHAFFKRRRLAGAVPAAVAVLFLFSFVVYVPRDIRTLGSSYNLMDDEMYKAAARAGVREGVVFVPAADRGYPTYGSVFWRNSPWLDAPVVWAKDRGPLNRLLAPSFGAKPWWRYARGRVVRYYPTPAGSGAR
jgi:hypothetical protein